VAAARDGHRVLIVSTDPAHSLGDAFGGRLSGVPRPIACGARRTIFAVELDAARALARWLREHRLALGDALEHGTWLDRHDVDALLELPVPGIDELLGMLEIVRISTAGDYTCVVVDTAPTGHTLRLLSAPAAVMAFSTVLDALQQEHRLVRERFARVSSAEAADRFLELLAAQAAETGALLRDGKRTACHWVLLPEDLSLAESADGLAALRAAGIPVTELIVNRVLPGGAPCPICDRRRNAERLVQARVAAGIGRRRIVTSVFEQVREPRGVAALGRLARSMQRSTHLARAPTRKPAGELLTSGARTGGRPFLEVIGGSRLLFFGGKGGVGKTTTAAAAAIALARTDANGRVLLLSTDPAHSLGDVLAVRVDDQPRTFRGGPSNLDVRELDAAAALASRRRELEPAFQDILDSFGAGAVRGHGVSELMDLAPPGIDELFGVLSVVEAQQQYRRIVIDTAPTGHALRLLETPGAARDWLQLLLRVLLKYRDLVRPGRLASELVTMSKSVRQLHEALQDPLRTQFIVVTRAAEVPRRETERLLARLRGLRLAAPALIVNARTMAPGTCPRCRTVSRIERREVAAIARARRRMRGECVIIETPLAAPPPRGIRALDTWARTWMR
jgi:arsenite-transporting ATPase